MLFPTSLAYINACFVLTINYACSINMGWSYHRLEKSFTEKLHTKQFTITLLF